MNSSNLSPEPHTWGTGKDSNNGVGQRRGLPINLLQIHQLLRRSKLKRIHVTIPDGQQTYTSIQLFVISKQLQSAISCIALEELMNKTNQNNVLKPQMISRSVSEGIVPNVYSLRQPRHQHRAPPQVTQ